MVGNPNFRWLAILKKHGKNHIRVVTETYNSLKKKETKWETPLLLKHAAKYFLEKLLLDNRANSIEGKKSSLGHWQYIMGMSPPWFKYRLIDYSQIYHSLPVETHSESPLLIVSFAPKSQA